MIETVLPVLERFLRRHYERDVGELNVCIGKQADTPVLSSHPPVPITGDVRRLKRGDCIAFIGLNPRLIDEYDGDKHKEFLELNAIVDRLIAGDEFAMQKYLAARATYFAGDGYRQQYYDRPGKLIARAIAPQGSPREVFRNLVFVADLLPWFSYSTKNIDWRKVAECSHPALAEHRTMLRIFLEALEPAWVQINGNESRLAVEALFEAPLTPIPFPGRRNASGKTARRPIYYVGETKISGRQTPLIVHKQRYSSEEYRANLVELFSKWWRDRTNGP